MKSLLLLCWALLVQYIASYLAGWSAPVILFTLMVTLLWQSLFIVIVSRIYKRQNREGQYQYSGLAWLIMLPSMALLLPILSLMILVVITIFEMWKASDCTGVVAWLRKNEQVTNEPYTSESTVPVEFEDIICNSPTGYPSDRER